MVRSFLPLLKRENVDTERIDHRYDHLPPLSTFSSSSSLTGPDLWKSRREAWLTGTLLLNPPAPKIRPDTSSTHSSEQDPLDGAAPTTTAHDDPTRAPVLSTIQSLSAKARGKLPSFLHLAYPPPTGPKAPSPPSSGGMLSSLDKLEMLMAEPGAEENDKVWRQGGLEAVWRMLTDSKTLKQPMRLGLVVRLPLPPVESFSLSLCADTNPQGRMDTRWNVAFVVGKGREIKTCNGGSRG
jgi:hypothetical protein